MSRAHTSARIFAKMGWTDRCRSTTLLTRDIDCRIIMRRIIATDDRSWIIMGGKSREKEAGAPRSATPRSSSRRMLILTARAIQRIRASERCLRENPRSLAFEIPHARLESPRRVRARSVFRLALARVFQSTCRNREKRHDRGCLCLFRKRCNNTSTEHANT